MKREKSLETIIVLMIALLLFYWWKQPTNPALARYLFIGALVLGAIALFIPFLSGLIHDGWMKLAEAIGYVMNRLLLGLIFFLFLTPIAFLFRLTKKGKLRAKDQASVYKERNFVYTAESMKDTW